MAAKYFSWTFPFCYKSFVTGHHACSPTPSQISIDILLQQQKMFDKNYRRLLINMIYNIFLLLMVGWCILNGWTLYPISPCQPLHGVGYPFDCPNNVCLIAVPNINQTPKQNYPSQLEKTSRYRKENEPEIFQNTYSYTNLAYNVMSAYLVV